MKLKIMSGLHGHQTVICETRERLQAELAKDKRPLFLNVTMASGQQILLDRKTDQLPQGEIEQVLAFPALAGG